MVITIIGGGHIGTTLAGYMAHLGLENEIRLHSSKPQLFSENREIKVNDFEADTSYTACIDMITDSFEDAVKGADIIFVTVPHFMVDGVFAEIKKYIKKGAVVGAIPGFGGVEFFWKKYFNDENTLFGIQRVPFTAKLAEYGKEANLKSWKKAIQVATIPISRLDEVIEKIISCTKFNCEKCSNYLNVTLTPSNPVLHTARIYDLFHNATKETVFPRKSKFYYEWTDHCSESMIGVDGELHAMFKNIPEIDFSCVLPLTVHYESPDVEAMTKKIISIKTFQSVYSPMKEVDGGFVADTGSRMFIEDYPFGLCIIKGFCEIFNMKTPFIDRELKWYEKFMGVEYFDENGEFKGKDLVNTGIPQNYGIHTKDDIISHYL